MLKYEYLTVNEEAVNLNNDLITNVGYMSNKSII